MAQAARNINQAQSIDQQSPVGPAASLTNARQIIGIVGLLLLLLLLLVLGGTFNHWLTNVTRLPMNKLLITGERTYTTDNDVRNVILNLAPLGTFLTQNVNAVQQQVERLPWIKQVSVRKQWPDELVVNLVEYQPVAYWHQQFLLDPQANIFSLPLSRLQPKKLPQLSGPEGSEQEVLAKYQQISPLLLAHHFQLASLELSAAGFWILGLDNGIDLRVSEKDLASQLKHFFIIYPILVQQQQQQHKQVKYIDLRYTSGIAVGWQLNENSNQNK